MTTLHATTLRLASILHALTDLAEDLATLTPEAANEPQHPENAIERMVRYSRGIEAGHLTPNEVRRLVGLPPLYSHERTAAGYAPDTAQLSCDDARQETTPPCCADARGESGEEDGAEVSEGEGVEIV